jgi:dienelactone hydrolase
MNRTTEPLTSLTKPELAFYGQALALSIFLLFSMISSVNAVEEISFRGRSKSASGDPLTLTGKLYKPQGDAPFPAMVLMHGCGGITEKIEDAWAKRLVSWGYVVLEVDSFGPRGKKNLCDDAYVVPENTRAQDAFDAKVFLSQQAMVDRRRIGIMGWAHGGGAVLCAISLSNMEDYHWQKKGVSPSDLIKGDGPFQAAVAFYPYCAKRLEDSESPLLILIGEKDSWCPAEMCKVNVPGFKTNNEIRLKIYHDTYHGFDAEDVDTVVAGYRVAYDWRATLDAIFRVRDFLAKYLK